MAIVRAALACMILTLSGLNGLLAGTMETCTGNAPDSLLGFVISLPLNVIGVALLCWRPQRVAVLLAALIPALLSIPYMMLAMELLAGAPACTVITGNPEWPRTGEETTLGLAWLCTGLILWIGLAYAMAGGYRRDHDQADNDSA